MLRSLVVVCLATLVVVPTVAAAPSGAPAEIASGLEAPWDVVPMGDGRTLLVERAGRIRELTGDTLDPTPVFQDTSGVTVKKFLGLVRDPDYATNGFLYLYETYNPGDGTRSRVLRLLDTGGPTLLPSGVLIDDIGSDESHDGGRMAFGPDGKLYVTTGDIHQPSRPRDKQNLNGKVLRLNPDGTPPADNPFVAEGGNARYVWSMGHRHPQGLAFDAAGRLWETEHGPSGEAHAPAGAKSGNDELNLIERGGDYGWPTVAGAQTLAGTIAPVVYSGPAPAWAPGDVEVGSDGLLYAPALNGRHVHVFETNDLGCVTRHGRVLTGGPRYRAAVADGTNLWLTTDTNPMKLLRVALVPGTAGIAWDAAPAPRTCVPPAAPQAPAPIAPLSPLPQTTPVPALAVAPASAAVAVATAASRATAAVRSLGLRRLLRAGSVAFRVGGLGAGRISARLSLIRSGRKPVTIAVGKATPRSRATITIRTKLTPSGRRAVRNLRTARLRVRIAFAPEAGAKVVRTATVTARR